MLANNQLRLPLVLICLILAVGGALSEKRSQGRAGGNQPLLDSGMTVLGERIVYPAGAPARITAAVFTLAADAETGWHTHGVPTFGYILQGEIEVDYGTKGKRVYRAGEAVLEAMRQPHNGRTRGAGPVKILVVYIGAEGVAATIPQRAQNGPVR